MVTSEGQKYQYYLFQYCLRVNKKQDIAEINSRSLPIILRKFRLHFSLSVCPSFIIHLFASTAHIHRCFLCISFSFSLLSFPLCSCPRPLCLFSPKQFDSLLEFEGGVKGIGKDHQRKLLPSASPPRAAQTVSICTFPPHMFMTNGRH